MQKRLLVADDSITIQKVVSLTFAGEDIAIESVADGDLAMGRIRESMPDLVLADVLMPGLSGYEVCAGIKSDPDLSKIPVVLLVGTFEPFDETEAARVKCDAWLTKPFDTTELLRVVHSLMGDESSGGAGEVSDRLTSISESGETDNLGIPMPSLPTSAVSDRTRVSFLGDQSVLDLFGPGSRLPVDVPAPRQRAATSATSDSGAPGTVEPVRVAGAPGAELSEETLDIIVDRVLRRLSQDVIREIAWEVVPEMSELIIRQCLEEKNKP